MVDTNVKREEFEELKNRFNDLLEVLGSIGLKKAVDFTELEIEENVIDEEEEDIEETVENEEVVL